MFSSDWSCSFTSVLLWIHFYHDWTVGTEAEHSLPLFFHLSRGSTPAQSFRMEACWSQLPFRVQSLSSLPVHGGRQTLAECVCFWTGSPEPLFSVLSYSYWTPKILKLLLYPTVFLPSFHMSPLPLKGSQLLLDTLYALVMLKQKKIQTKLKKNSNQKPTKTNNNNNKKSKTQKRVRIFIPILSYSSFRKESPYPTRQVIHSKVTINVKG